LSILTAALALTYSVGGLLINTVLLPDKLSSASSLWLCIPIWLLWTTSLVLFAVAILKCFQCIRVRSDFRSINEEDIFNRYAMLHPETKKEDVACYKRYMAQHFWRINSENYNINQDKGGLLTAAHTLAIVGV
jgi:hypothetical protein